MNMTGQSSLEKMRQVLERKKGTLAYIQKQKQQVQDDLAKNQKMLQVAKDGQLILQIVAHQTQSMLEYRLNELVSLAQIAVFRDEAYQLEMRFNIKRGRTEAEPIFVKRNMQRRPMYGTGFGAVDIAALVLRPTLWSLEPLGKRKRPTFIWDEPLRHLNDPTGELHKRATTVIKEISRKVNKPQGIQIIVVTQNATLCDAGDKIFYIDQKDGESFIKEIEQ
jgi:DNA repair exonuclease SbcCD ATPase subunit